MNDNVNKDGWKALLGSAVGYAMDGFDLLILGFMLSAISADLALTRPIGLTCHLDTDWRCRRWHYFWRTQ